MELNTPSQFILNPLTEAHAKQICTWNYPVPYDIYNFSDWETVVANGWDLANPEVREQDLVSIELEGKLMAFGRMNILDEAVNIGIGLSPSDCGQGYGKGIVEALIQEAKKRLPNRIIGLSVRTFNDRAIRCYQKSGFEITETSSKDIDGQSVDYYFMKLMK